MNRKRSSRPASQSKNRGFQFETLEPRNMLAISIGSGLDYFNFTDSTLVYNLQPGTLAADKIDVLRTHVGASMQDSFRQVSSNVDQLGITHDRYQQVFAGIDVLGGVYTVHSANGHITSLSGSYVNMDPAQPAFAGLGHEIASDLAMDYLGQREIQTHGSGATLPDGPLLKRFVQDDPVLAEIVGLQGDPAGDLLWYTDRDNQTELVWQFDLYVIEPQVERAYVYVNANTGDIEGTMDRIHGADTPATGTSLYDGTVNFTADLVAGLPLVYRLRQAVNGVETYDMLNGTSYAAAVDIENPSSDFLAAPLQTGVQTHWGTENTLQYFLSTHGRDSYDDAGAILRSYVSYGVDFVNAFWNGSVMTYGDGNGTSFGPLVSLDVVGHEITHGVTEFSANLIYSYESGALNESFSDIFGEMVERFARGSNDWMMGADFDLIDGDGFRNIADPNLKGDPDTYMGTFWNPGPSDHGGVHTNSGVQNKWFYILGQGEAGINDHGFVYDVVGIGLDDAEAIAYRNLTTYLTPGSTFQDAREGAIQAAIDLFGPGSLQHQSTDHAWEAVGVYAKATTVEFTPLAPEGSLIYEALFSSTISAGSPFSDYALDLDANQQLTVIVEGETGSLLPQVTVLDPSSAPMIIAGPTIGNTTIVQTLDVTSSGIYNVSIAGVTGTTGTYDLRFLLNSDIELETFGIGDNGTLAMAVDLDPASIDLGGLSTSASRIATLGILNPAASTSASDDFETGVLDPALWETFSSHPAGQVQVTDAHGASGGSFALMMDTSSFGAFNLNEAIFTVDLAGEVDPYLTFDYVSFGDENDALPQKGFAGHFNGDGVSISEDGLLWYPVLTDTNTAAGVWESASINLTMQASIFGITLGDDFKIKFQQFDDFPILFADGRGIDNVSIGAPSGGSADDWYSFAVNAGDPFTVAGTSFEAVPNVTVELYDAAEILLSPGIAGTTVHSYITQYVAPAAETYYVRVFGDGDYSLVVTRDAEFDTEPGGPQDLSLVSGALGHVSALSQLVAEPDDFNDGDFLDGVYTDVDLSNNGGGASVYAALAQFTPPTGTLVFAPALDADEGWNEGAGDILRADFLTPQAYVSIDVGSDDDSDVGVLRAYDFTGTLLAEVFSGGVTNGSSETIFIKRAIDEIAYIEATGVGGDITPLDRLVYKKTDIDEDTYTIDATAGQLINMSGFLPGDGPGQFTNLLGEVLPVALEMRLLDPSATLVATGTTTLTHTALVSGTYQLIVSATDDLGEYYVAHHIHNQSNWNFDINRDNSTTEFGFQPLDMDDLYDALAGYGWLSHSSNTDWAEPTGSDLFRDGIRSQLSEFAAHVPNGDYEIELIFGNRPSGTPQSSIFTLEGNAYALSPGIDSSITKVITISDGQFNLTMDGNGGTNTYAYLSGLRVLPLTSTEWMFDINRNASPTEAGFTPLDRDDLYDPLERYGWLSHSAATDWDDVTASDLNRDGIRTQLSEFAAGVVDGMYEIELYFGNRPSGTQSSLFTLEGNAYSLTTAANSSYVQVVTVSDGQFNLTMDGNGGTNTYAYLSGLRISPLTSTEWMFDINRNASPTEAGFTPLDRDDLYDPLERYGWLSHSSATDWDDVTASDLNRDGIRTQLSEFAADVVDGMYEIELYFGNRPSGTQSSIFTLEGNAYSLTAATNTSYVQVVTVSDGQFNLTMDGDGGTNTFAYLSGLRISPLTSTEWAFDINRNASPTETGFQPLDRDDLFNPLERYGWLSHSAATDWDDVTGSDLDRDGIRTQLSEFAADVVNGFYEVELYFGNLPAGTPQSSIFTLEGTPYSLTPAANSSYVQVVTVTDGQFNLVMDGNGGTNTYAYLSGLQVTPITYTEWIFDINRNASPTETGFQALDRDDLYDPLQRYGWISHVSTTDWDDVTGSDLDRDGIRTQLSEFAADVNDGVYEIELYFGNLPAGTPQSSVFVLENTSFTLSPAANSSIVQTVTVSDGQFNLTLDGDGGSIAYAYLSGLRITPVIPFAGRGSAFALAEPGGHVPATVIPDFGTSELVHNRRSTTGFTVATSDLSDVPAVAVARSEVGRPALSGLVTDRWASVPRESVLRDAGQESVEPFSAGNLDQVFRKALDDLFSI